MSTPVSAPLIAGTRLRRGPANSARGAARFVADMAARARKPGASGLVIMRFDSAFYNADVSAAAHRGGATVSITITEQDAHPHKPAGRPTEASQSSRR